MALLMVWVTFPVLAEPASTLSGSEILDHAFACGPGELADESVPVDLRQHLLQDGAGSLMLPRTWKSPQHLGRDAVKAESADGKIRLRWTRETLRARTFEEAVSAHEGRYFGLSRSSVYCARSLEERYRPASVDAANFRAYRSRFAYRGIVSTYVLFFEEGPYFHAFVLEVEWGRRRPPNSRVIDVILRRFAAAH